MNRNAALLLALTTLLAHSLLIHQDSAGHFAAPYDSAHATYRLARHLVFTGEASWNPSAFVLEAGPSPLWLYLCAVAERLYLPVTTFAQTVGTLCMLATAVLAARFTRDRLVGVIAPFLLVVNGGIAAAGPGGTETSLLTLLVTATFLAHERRAPRVFALAASALWLVRWEGAFVVWILLGLEVLRILRRRSDRRFLPAFLAPFATGAALVAWRLAETGELLSPSTASLATGSPELGAPYLLRFVLTSGTPLLVVFPMGYLLRRRLVGRARRGLFVALAWTLAVVWTGGNELPLWQAMVPVLPLLFLAVQDAITLAIDGRRRWVAHGAVAMLLVGAAVSVLASKLPGQIGPLPRIPLPRTWIPESEDLELAYARSPGRTGLVEEIERTDRKRSLGIFLRDNLGGRATLLTPWPGSIGYLSRRVLHDVRGRVTLTPGRERLAPWYGAPRSDLVGLLRTRPDYIAGWIDPGRPPIDREEYVRSMLRRYDTDGDAPERVAEALAALTDYELIAVPVPAHSADPDVSSDYPAYLLRRADLRLTPRLRIQRDGARFRVFVVHRGHFQLADLVVTAQDRERRQWAMRPTGVFEEDADVRARTRLLLFGSGSRNVQLVEGTLPPELADAVLHAELRNPGSEDPTSRPAVAR